MKIEAIIRPSRLDEVLEVLEHEWIAGVTVSEVKGHGPPSGHPGLHRGAEYEVDVNPRLKVELVVPGPLVPRLLHDLLRRLRTGRRGDGQVLVTAVDEAIRVRTGERGEAAL